MDQLASLRNRPIAYYNIDGVGELGIGFMCLGYALLQWLQISTPPHSVWNRIYTLFIYVGVMVAVIHYGSKAIKEHITYPRTGFVEYRRRKTLWLPMAVAVFVSIVAASALFTAIRGHWNLTTPASLFGLVLAAAYAHGIARTVRWKWIVAGAVVAGSLVIAFLPAEVVGALADQSWITQHAGAQLVAASLLTMLLYGTALMISGGISFWLYLRHTEAPIPEER